MRLVSDTGDQYESSTVKSAAECRRCWGRCSGRRPASPSLLRCGTAALGASGRKRPRKSRFYTRSQLSTTALSGNVSAPTSCLRGTKCSGVAPVFANSCAFFPLRSAGVGRTGTFIVIDSMIDMMHMEQRVDVFGSVSRIREQRCQLIQTDVSADPSRPPQLLGLTAEPARCSRGTNKPRERKKGTVPVMPKQKPRV